MWSAEVEFVNSPKHGFEGIGGLGPEFQGAAAESADRRNHRQQERSAVAHRGDERRGGPQRVVPARATPESISGLGELRRRLLVGPEIERLPREAPQARGILAVDGVVSAVLVEERGAAAKSDRVLGGPAPDLGVIVANPEARQPGLVVVEPAREGEGLISPGTPKC